MDARKVARSLGVDRHETGMGVTRAKHGCVEHPGRQHVGDEAAGAGGEAIAAEPMVGLADHLSRVCSMDGGPTEALGPLASASRSIFHA